MRMAQSQDDPASQRREEVGKLQEDRSKAVIANALSEATKAVEKASTEAPRRQRRHAVQSNGQSDSRSQSKQFSVYRRGGRVVEDVKANIARHHARHHAKP